MAANLCGITAAETQVLQALEQGLSNKAIAAVLVLSPRTVECHVSHLLAKTGWLAEGKLNSIEFQTREAFTETLGELSQLDQITGKLSLQETIKRLNQLCNERLFQPKTRGNPAIQILGVLESTGLDFDALWFGGLTEASWPPAAHPNPLLPIEAQRRQLAPNSCANVQLDFAQRLRPK